MRKTVDFLSSVTFFISLALALVTLFVWQTVFNVSDSLYRSWWFLALVALLVLNTLLCLLKRIKTACWHFILLHFGIVLVLIGGALTMSFRFEGQLPLLQGRPSDIAATERGYYRIPFSVELTDFKIEYYRSPYLVLYLNNGRDTVSEKARAGREIPFGGARIRILRVLSDFAIGEDGQAFNRSAFWNNPALALEIVTGDRIEKRWLFLNFPGHSDEKFPFRAALRLFDSDIRNFVSRIAVRYKTERIEGTLSVNSPFRYRGYVLYQTSYDPARPDLSILTVKREKFLWLVYIGFILLLSGVLLWLRLK